MPKAAWLQHGSNVSGVLAGRERALTSHAYNRIRAVTLKVRLSGLAHYSALHGRCAALLYALHQCWKHVWLEYNHTQLGAGITPHCMSPATDSLCVPGLCLQLLQRSNPVWHPHGFPARSLEAAPSPAAGAQVSLHSAVLEQFKMRLVAASSSSSRQQHDTGGATGWRSHD